MDKSKSKPRGKPFQVGDDHRRKQSIAAAQAAQPEEEQPQEPLGGDVLLYQDMRWVYTKPKGADRTQGHRTCRAWLDDDPRGFMGKLASFEEAAAAREAAQAAREADGLLVDPASDQLEELCLSLLEEAGGFLDLEPGDRELLMQRGLVGGDGDDCWRLTAAGRRVLGLPARA